MKGQYFFKFVRKLESLDYTVKWRILISADYGDPTTRRRLFVQARKHEQIVWPNATHDKDGKNMFQNLPRWRNAREIIDWDLQSQSIFKRKKPLAANTLKRIQAGLLKYGGEAFVLGQQSQAAPRTVNEPIPTVAGAGAISLIEPFIIQMDMGGRMQSVDETLNTVTSADARGLVEPFLIEYHGTGESGQERIRSLDQPIPTIDTSNRYGLVEPFIIPTNHGKGDLRTHDLGSPMPSITTVDAWALISPFMVLLNGTSPQALAQSQRSIDKPVPTIVGSSHIGLAQPYLIEYNGMGIPSSVDLPLPTVTRRDRFALIEPFVVEHEGKTYLVDILFRMLQPHELAAGMGFPKTYKFAGNREQKVKQIGNAVTVNLAAELCGAILNPYVGSLA